MFKERIGRGGGVAPRLFKAAVALFGACSCKQKRVGSGINGKVAPSWNQKVKDAIQAKKLAC